MNDLPGLPPVSAEKGVGATVTDSVEGLDSDVEGQQAFDDALEDGGDLHESQAPDTRRAIKGSLDRLPDRQSADALQRHGAAKGLPDRRGSYSLATGAGKPRFVATPEAGYANTIPGKGGQPSPGASDSQTASLSLAPGGVRQDPAPSGVSVPIRGRPMVSTPEAQLPVGTRSVEEDAPGSGPSRSQGAALAGSEGTAVRKRAGASDSLSPGNAEPTPAGDRAARGPSKEGTNAALRKADTSQRAKPLGKAQRLSRGPGLPSQPDQPRRARPGEGIARSRPESGISTPGSDRAETPGPDDAGNAEAQPVDMTGLATPASVPEPQGVASPETVQASAPRAAELAEQVADRILVSAPEPGSAGEVRISLKESVLDGSDVRIFREGGELRIVFLPKTEAAGQLLAENSAVFQQTLGERLQDERVHVEVEPPERRGADQQDSEGRSRQRYVSPDDPSATD